MGLEKELVRLAVFAGLIAKIEDPKEEDYIFLWRKAENIAKRIISFEKRNRDLIRAIKHQTADRKEGKF